MDNLRNSSSSVAGGDLDSHQQQQHLNRSTDSNQLSDNNSVSEQQQSLSSIFSTTTIPSVLLSNDRGNDFNDDDLEIILQQYLSSETDVDLLTEKLSKQLSTLETEMVIGILDSGVGVNEVTNQLKDKDQTHLTAVTAWIDYYNKQLQDMKKYIEHIESKNNRMEIVSRNQRLLLTELSNLLQLMTLDERTVKCLTSPEFGSVAGLKAATEAAGKLKKALTTKLKSGMEHMIAVKDQRKVFETYKLSFARKVSTLIESVFKVTDANKEYIKMASESEIPEHTGFYDLLNNYKPLVHWLKELDHDKFSPLIPLYIKAYRSSYKHEVKDFFSNLQHSIIKESKDQNDFFSSGKKAIESSKPAVPQTPPTPTKSGAKRRTVDKTFRYSLSCLETSIMSEQKFLMSFFKLRDPPNPIKVKSSTSSATPTTATTTETSASSPTTESSPVTSPTGGSSITENHLDTILSEMFEGVVPELKELAEKADHLNPFYLLTMLIDTEQFIASHTELGDEYSSYIIKILSEVQKTMKTLFNKFIDLQVESIKSTQTSLKRCGVLPHFKNFHVFVNSLEKYRSKNEEESISSLINSSYYKVIVNLYGWLDGLAEKLQPDDKYKFISKLVKMEELGIECLKTYQETSNTHYQTNLNIYTDYLINLKFKPLIEFYEKMDELLLTLPPTDIQFQQSHSKQQYKKMVEKFKTENIEKGLLKALLNIYKNIAKDSVVIGVVWEHLEKVFIAKYDHFQEITEKCYQQTIPVSSDQIRGIFATVFRKNPNKGH
eukprot:gene1407-1776_t